MAAAIAEISRDEAIVSRVTVWSRFRRHRLAVAGACVLAVMIFVAVGAPKLAPYDPTFIDQVHWQGNPLPPCFQNAVQCGGHSLGTDESGRDELSRLMFGAQVSLTIAVSAVIMEIVIGVLVGAIAGYYDGSLFSLVTAGLLSLLGSFAPGAARWIDATLLSLRTRRKLGWTEWFVNAPVDNALAAVGLALIFVPNGPWLVIGIVLVVAVLLKQMIFLPVDYVLMRVTDVFLSIPLLPLLLVLTGIVAASSSKASLSFGVIVLIIGGLSWPSAARLVRAAFLSLREREYAEAARALGNRDIRIMLRHLLPNAMAPIIVQATLDVANVIILESVLSFLGLGIQPPTSSWGSMLANAQSNLEVAWWAAVFPGLCILFTVLAINYIGDGLRDALDPSAVR